MSITYERSYKASDGKCYGTLDEAQQVEIAELLKAKGFINENDAKIASGIILSAKDELLAILTLNDSSRPKARGSKKPRKPKVAEQGESQKAA